MDKPVKRKKAAALRYQPGTDASPTMVGAGSGKIAEHILELAKKHNIPIHEDADLVEILAHLNPGDEIPPATYVVVAEILSFVYQVNEKAGTSPSR
ncbi:MAG: EscU/YscU/HrcU family type III secretion system export apparatus switch protein [Spirochaetales bacterium]|jgi:flagellar biosynthesis protein|nr:EscU/YscU/HrcU family type III secretion system export apparatus switch protein [Spirochaetales bacterium]